MVRAGGVSVVPGDVCLVDAKKNTGAWTLRERFDKQHGWRVWTLVE